MLLELGMIGYAMDKHILYPIRQLTVKYIRGAINHTSNDLQECMYYSIENKLEMFQPRLIKSNCYISFATNIFTTDP